MAYEHPNSAKGNQNTLDMAGNKIQMLFYCGGSIPLLCHYSINPNTVK